jgi:ABC-type amino acid transport substrate-binding protein
MRRSTFGSAVLGTILALPGGAGDLADVKAHGSLRVIAAEGEQPEEFSFKAEGEPGFEREMLEAFARLEHLKLTTVRVKAWDERIPALLRGEGDVIVGLIETPARRKLVEFTAETLPARHVVVTCAPHPVISTVEDLVKERVGVLKGTSWAQAAAEAGVPASGTVDFNDPEPLLDALKAGRIGATVMSVSDFTLSAKRTPSLQAGVFVGPPVHQGWAVRKEDKELAQAMNDYIQNVRRTSTWNRLIVKYFGDRALEVLGRAHAEPVGPLPPQQD